MDATIERSRSCADAGCQARGSPDIQSIHLARTNVLITPSRPFRRLRFEEIPEAPRLAHAYAQSEAHETMVESPHFGRHRVHWREWGSGPPLLLVHGLMT